MATPGEAQAEGNAQREKIYERERGLATEAGDEYEPQVVTEQENYEAMTLASALAAVTPMKPDLLRESSEAWKNIGKELSAAVEIFDGEIRKSMAGWGGTTAEVAAAGILTYAAETGRLGTSIQLVGNKIEEAYTGFDQTKKMIESIPVPNPSPILDQLYPDIKIADAMMAETNEYAARTMRTVYGQVVVQADTNVPSLPTPFDPTAGGTPGQPYSTGTYGRPTGATPSNGSTPATGDGEAAEQPADGAATGTPATEGSQSDASGQQDSGQSSGQDSSEPANTNAASATPSGADRPFGSPGTGAAGSSGYGGGTGGYGGGSGGGGSSGSGFSTGNPTGPGPAAGAVLAPAASVGAGSAAAASSTPRGAMPMGGMAPGAARGAGGSDDTEHETPSYLINIDNGNELIGKMQPVAPAVIGG